MGAPFPARSGAPPTGARLLAVLAIVLGGLCGGLIGYSVAELQCDADTAPVAPLERAEDRAPAPAGCGAGAAVAGLAGALVGAGGVAVIAVLVLRAMVEWKDYQDRVHGPPGDAAPPR